MSIETAENRIQKTAAAAALAAIPRTTKLSTSTAKRIPMLPLDLARLRSSVNKARSSSSLMCAPDLFHGNFKITFQCHFRGQIGARLVERAAANRYAHQCHCGLHVSGVPAQMPWLRFLLKSLVNLNPQLARLLHGLPPPPQWSGQWSRTLPHQIPTHQCKTRG